MADPKRDTSDKAPASAMPKEQIDGPVPQRHRNKLGEADGQTNPYGQDSPSTKASTARHGHPGH